MNMPSDASSDQSNCPNGYYRNTSGMVMQSPVICDSQSPAPISAADLGKLVENPDELRKLAKTKLVQVIHHAPISTALVPAIKELLDRIDGKPSQSIAMTVEAKGIDKLSDDRLLALERELARITGQGALVISPMPKKLEHG